MKGCGFLILDHRSVGPQVDLTRIRIAGNNLIPIAYVTPTILFVDHTGRQLAERMVGINTIEMYGGYLDQCIDTALMHIRQPELAARHEACRLMLRRPGETSPAQFNPATT